MKYRICVFKTYFQYSVYSIMHNLHGPKCVFFSHESCDPSKLNEEKMVSWPKKKKRKLTDSDVEGQAKVQRQDDDAMNDDRQSVSSSLALPWKKTKGFSWAQYLEQEKAKGLPARFFKEVYFYFITILSSCLQLLLLQS